MKIAARYFNPRSPCGERLNPCFLRIVRRIISIHAPRAGSDPGYSPQFACQQISIHAPRAGSDYESNMESWDGRISIHAPRAGSDEEDIWCDDARLISIHAPRAGSDLPRMELDARGHNFNPRSPCGERRRILETGRMERSFQSTLPVRGATGSQMQGSAPWNDFNPRSPCGERPYGGGWHGWRVYFNPRSPCGERQKRGDILERKLLFQSTLPVRGATICSNRF